MKQKEQELLIYNNSIDFNFKDFSQEYLVEITIDEDEEILNTVTYKTHISYTKEYRDPYFLAEVNFSDFLLNGKMTESLMQTIAVECGKAIDTCVFQINSSNEIIDLDNHKQILEKWHILKQRIMQENEGETVEKFITHFEINLFDKVLLLKKLRKNIFINQYFYPIFDEPYHGFKKKNVETFDFFDVEYKEDVLIEINNEGTFDENEYFTLTKKVITNQKNTIQNYQTNYILDKNKSIKKIEGEFLNDNRKYSYNIR